MERGPLPPHERTWRHPSELAAEERAALRAEAAAPSTRVFALTTGTLGLLAVAVLVLTVTPRQASPVAVSATTSTAVSIVGPGSAPAALTGRRPAFTESVSIGALATPIGDGRFALITRNALAATTGAVVEVRLPSGRTGAAQVVVATADDAVVVVALGEIEPGHDIADDPPDDDEIVTVLASPPVTVPFDEVDTLDVADGTAVLDGDGDLVGLCSRDGNDGPVEVIGVSDELTDGTTSATGPREETSVTDP